MGMDTASSVSEKGSRPMSAAAPHRDDQTAHLCSRGLPMFLDVAHGLVDVSVSHGVASMMSDSHHPLAAEV